MLYLKDTWPKDERRTFDRCHGRTLDEVISEAYVEHGKLVIDMKDDGMWFMRLDDLFEKLAEIGIHASF